MNCKDLLKALAVCAVISCVWLNGPSKAFAETRGSRSLFRPVAISKSTALPKAEQEKLAKLRALETTKDIQLTYIRMYLFRSKSMDLNLIGDKPLGALTEKVERRSATDFTWFGKVNDPSGTGEAIMVVKDGRVTGTIQAGGELYEIVPLGSGRHAVVHVDQSKFPRSSEPPGPAPRGPEEAKAGPLLEKLLQSGESK